MIRPEEQAARRIDAGITRSDQKQAVARLYRLCVDAYGELPAELQTAVRNVTDVVLS